MTRFSIKPLMVAATLAALSVPAFAEPPAAWELKPDMGYGYDKEGKTFAYKMGTSNAGAAAERRQEGAEGHAVLHRTERTALYADRTVSGGRRQVHVRIELIQT